MANFFVFARDYLHSYMPKTCGLSPKTIEAYRISLECFLTYLADSAHVQRAHVSFEHFDRKHLKAWVAWMADDRHYATRTVSLRLTAVKAFLAYCSHEDITLVALSQAAKALPAAASQRQLNISPKTKPERSLPLSPAGRRNLAGTGCCSSCYTIPLHTLARSRL